MTLESPNLDDRDFDKLLSEALQRAKKSCPQWSDHSPGDPGVALLESFAYLTELMLYRLNRLPGKVYIELLRLMGIKLYPPIAARADLRFSIQQPRTTAIVIPERTRITVGRPSADQAALVFMTVTDARIDPGKTEVMVPAYHMEMIVNEKAGVGTGKPGQVITLKKPPLVAPLPEAPGLMVRIQTESPAQDSTAAQGRKTYRVWREVESFSQTGNDPFVYTVDRITGVITFASAVYTRPGPGADTSKLAEYPGNDMEILVSYCRGGGANGNIAENSPMAAKDISGITVTNPQPATGGMDAESVSNALRRGPQELHSLERAVTARDFEMLAERNAGAERAKAFTQQELWTHATPGTVEILLVPPYLKPDQRGTGAVTAEVLHKQETAQALKQIHDKLDEVRPLGTRCHVTWARYKTVRVKADIVVYRGEDPAAIKQRVLARLHEAINPLPASTHQRGWKFGEPLRVSQVYGIILAEPGVRYVDKVRLLIEEAPDKEVATVIADAHQSDTWYAAAGNAVFRSMNNGDSWERTGTFEDPPEVLQSHPDKPGYVVAVARRPDGQQSRVYVSADCAETWRPQVAELAFRVENVSWATRDGRPILLLATDKGLYELPTEDARPAPIQIMVDPAQQDMGLYNVVSWTDQGSLQIAVSAQSSKGVYLSAVNATARERFTAAGLAGEDVRRLTLQRVDSRIFLWAGLAVAGREPGKGCYRLEMIAGEPSKDSWRQYGKGWVGGSCNTIAFADSRVFAATHHAGVVILDLATPEQTWSAPNISSRLPTRDDPLKEARVFAQVKAAATATAPDRKTVLACGPLGIFRSADHGITYDCVSRLEFTEKLTLPSTWLFCSGEHIIEVVKEHEARGD